MDEFMWGDSETEIDYLDYGYIVDITQAVKNKCFSLFIKIIFWYN